MKGLLVLFSALLNFWRNNRRGGTTTLLRTIAEQHDCWVLVWSEEEVEQFGKNGLNYSRLLQSPEILEARPVLVDNHFMLKLLERGFDQMDHMQKKHDAVVSSLEQIHALADRQLKILRQS